MKNLSKFINECLGVTNHYTPISNIITNVRNFFGERLGIIASIHTDGKSLVLQSSKFTSEEEINNILWDTSLYRTMSLGSYIQQQGLSDKQIIPDGAALAPNGYFKVIFSPHDIIGDREYTGCPTCYSSPCDDCCDDDCNDEDDGCSECDPLSLEISLAF